MQRSACVTRTPHTVMAVERPNMRSKVCARLSLLLFVLAAVLILYTYTLRQESSIQLYPRIHKLRQALPNKFIPLTPDEVHGIKKFVLFTGYPASAHSIMGSMMDAHSNIIVSHEFTILEKILHYPRLAKSRTTLFNAIYNASYNDVTVGWRSPQNDKKGYTLGTGSRWQGRFSELTVIGDKSGGRVARLYYEFPDAFDHAYHLLEKTIAPVQLSILHVVRNPYDMAATDVLYKTSHQPQGVKKEGISEEKKYDNPSKLAKHIDLIEKRADAILEMIGKYNMNVLELHNCDFVLHPKETLTKICDFLEIDCPQDYLEECDEKVFKHVSRTRNYLVWDESNLRKVEVLTQKYPFFRRYTFESN